MGSKHEQRDSTSTNSLATAASTAWTFYLNKVTDISFVQSTKGRMAVAAGSLGVAVSVHVEKYDPKSRTATINARLEGKPGLADRVYGLLTGAISQAGNRYGFTYSKA